MSSCWTPQGELRPHFSALFNQLEAINGSFSGPQLDPSFSLSPEQQLSYSTFGKSLADEQKPIYVSMEAMNLGRGGGGSMRVKALPPIRVPIREKSPAPPSGDPFLSPQEDSVSVTFSVLSQDVAEGEEEEDEEDGNGNGRQDLEDTAVPSSAQGQFLPPDAGRVPGQFLPPDAGCVMSSLSSTPVTLKRSDSSNQCPSGSGGNKQQQPPLANPKQGAVPMVQLDDLGSRFDSSSATLTTSSHVPLLQDSRKTSFFGGTVATPPAAPSLQHLETRGGASAFSSTAAEATNRYSSGPPPHPTLSLRGRGEEAELRGVSPLHRLSSDQDRLSGIEGGASKSTDSGIRSGDETGGSVTPTPSGDNRGSTPTPSGTSRLSRNSFGLDSGLTDLTNDIMANFANKMVSLRSN